MNLQLHALSHPPGRRPGRPYERVGAPADPQRGDRDRHPGRPDRSAPLRRALRLSCSRGPAVIASIAYMDPGNFATNIQAGAGYGYTLLWVVLPANLIAMLFQALSAKLGIVTGRNLAELCREHFPHAVVYAMWVFSEIAAMATDLAEFLGGAIGLSLAVRHAALRRHGGHRRRDLRHPDVRGQRLSADRADHRRPGRRDRPLLPDRAVHRPGRLGERPRCTPSSRTRPTRRHSCSRSASSAPP